MADDHKRATFEAEREALRSALHFPDPPYRAEDFGPGPRPGDARPRLRQQAGKPSMEPERYLLQAIAAAVEHMATSLDSLVERVERLTERLDALEAVPAKIAPVGAAAAEHREDRSGEKGEVEQETP